MLPEEDCPEQMVPTSSNEWADSVRTKHDPQSNVCLMCLCPSAKLITTSMLNLSEISIKWPIYGSQTINIQTHTGEHKAMVIQIVVIYALKVYNTVKFTYFDGHIDGHHVDFLPRITWSHKLN